MKNLNIITVWTGDRYKREYVDKMRSMLERHLTWHELSFYCITDRPEEIDWYKIIPPQTLPGWWGKMYLFSDLMPEGPCLYLDLDQIILGDITEIIETCLQHPFSCYADHISWKGVKLGTSLMTFQAQSMKYIFDEFWAKKEAIMEEYAEGGDQIYLGSLLHDVFYLDEYFPKGTIESYKFDTVPKGGPGPDCKLINMHGLPKAHHVAKTSFIREHWV